MEYKVKNENGEMVPYRLLDGNTTPEKVIFIGPFKIIGILFEKCA
jgi:hypothetical protein